MVPVKAALRVVVRGAHCRTAPRCARVTEQLRVE